MDFRPRVEKLIDGYIRNVEKLFIHSNPAIYIPIDVRRVCLLFVVTNDDTFSIINCCQDIRIISKENTEMVVLSSSKCTASGCVYLCNQVVSGIHHWKFKLINLGETRWRYQASSKSMMIGIFNAKYSKELYGSAFNIVDSSEDDDIYNDLATTGYGLSTHGELSIDPESEFLWQPGCNRRYAGRMRENMIIEMILDSNTWTLNYSINRKRQNRAFDIEEGIYCAVIVMRQMDQCISLISYSCQI